MTEPACGPHRPAEPPPPRVRPGTGTPPDQVRLTHFTDKWVPLPAPESVTYGALFVFFNEWVRLVGGGRGERGLGKKMMGGGVGPSEVGSTCQWAMSNFLYSWCGTGAFFFLLRKAGSLVFFNRLAVNPSPHPQYLQGGTTCQRAPCVGLQCHREIKGCVWWLTAWTAFYGLIRKRFDALLVLKWSLVYAIRVDWARCKIYRVFC